VDRDYDDRLERSGVGSRPVVNHADDVRVRRSDDIGVREARNRFGGIDVPAAIAGTLAALGMSVLLGGLLAAAGLLRYGDNAAEAAADAANATGAATETTLAAGAAITALVIALLSVAFGAWVAGRMARYDGGRNGILTAVLYVLSLAGLSAAGLGLGQEATNGEVGVRLGDLTDSDAFGPLGIAGALGAIALLLLTGWAFGRLGTRFHRKADAYIAGTRDGAIATTGHVTHVREGGLHTDRDLHRDDHLDRDIDLRDAGLRDRDTVETGETWRTDTVRSDDSFGSDDSLRGVTGSSAVTDRARELDVNDPSYDRTRRGTEL